MPLQSSPNTTTMPARRRRPGERGSGRGQMTAAPEVQTIADTTDPCQNGSMPLRRTLLGRVVVSFAVSAVLSGAASQMPISDVRAGLVGIGYPVFDGTPSQDSKAPNIGVL